MENLKFSRILKCYTKSNQFYYKNCFTRAVDQRTYSYSTKKKSKKVMVNFMLSFHFILLLFPYLFSSIGPFFSIFFFSFFILFLFVLYFFSSSALCMCDVDNFSRVRAKYMWTRCAHIRSVGVNGWKSLLLFSYILSCTTQNDFLPIHLCIMYCVVLCKRFVFAKQTKDEEKTYKH